MGSSRGETRPSGRQGGPSDPESGPESGPGLGRGSDRGETGPTQEVAGQAAKDPSQRAGTATASGGSLDALADQAAALRGALPGALDRVIHPRRRHHAEPFPHRPDLGTLPLIDAGEAYPALEELLLSARREVLLGFRILDPSTRLRNPKSAEAGLETWGDLVRHVLERGVEVRLLLTDFEPTVANTLHQATWRSLDGFREVAKQAEKKAGKAAGRLQQIAALHEGELGMVARRLFWPLVRLQLRRKARHARLHLGTTALVRSSPGLWRLFKRRGGTLEVHAKRPPRLWPATYHQKMAVFDGEIAVLGGLDVDERRFDDQGHERPAEETWHDVSLLAPGPVAADARRHFLDCWNREVPRFNARLTALGAPRRELPALVERLAPHPPGGAPETEETAGHDTSGGGTVRVVRTRSRRSHSPLALGPKPAIAEIEEAHLALIARAQRLVYIETQYFRSRSISEALAEAGRKRPDLHCILVIPAAPEDVAFAANRGVDARHGEWLQVKAIQRVTAAFGERFAAYSLVRDAAGEESGERDALEGRQIVYLHSKVAVADSRSAIVSSANLNGRSLRWDTECGLVWSHDEAVRAFQMRLWRHHLRGGLDHEVAPDSPEAFRMWRRAAEARDWNGERRPLVARYPLQRARAFAGRVLFVPENLV